jgi:hypothetical protein
VIDPVLTWVLAGAGKLVGPELAWNCGVFMGLVVAGLGGERLAKAWAPDNPDAGLVGAVGVMTMPILIGSFSSGLTEDFFWGLPCFALAFALQGQWRKAGLLLGLSSGFGLYLGWLGGLAVGVVGVRSLWRRGGSWRMLQGAVIALGFSMLWALPFLERLEGEAVRVEARKEPFWKLNPWQGSDILSFVQPGKQELLNERGEPVFLREHPSYLGLVTVGLALYGGWSPAFIGVLGCMVAALGPNLSVGGEPVGKNPAMEAFQLLPLGSRWHHHARLMLLGQTLLVMLAARKGGKWGALSIGLESMLLSPERFPLPVTPATSPQIYTRLAELPDAPVVVLGASGPGIHPQKVFFDKRAHGRELLNNPDRPGIPRRLPAPVVVVVLGDWKKLEERLGEPGVAAEDGAAWFSASADLKLSP